MSMLDFLRRRLVGNGGDRGTTPQAGREGDTETVRRIVSALDRLEPERARYIAAFAYVLGRVALADRQVTEEETRLMERVVVQHGDLPEDQAIVVVQMAKSQNLLFGGTEDFLVTREFNEIATPAQKLALLDCLFAVSAADESIATVEDNEIRRVAVELKIPFEDFVRTRLSYRGRLSVLKRRDDDRS